MSESYFYPSGPIAVHIDSNKIRVWDSLGQEIRWQEGGFENMNMIDFGTVSQIIYKDCKNPRLTFHQDTMRLMQALNMQEMMARQPEDTATFLRGGMSVTRRVRQGPFF